MKARATLLCLILVASAAHARDVTVRVNGHAIHLDVVTARQPNTALPTIVFESGLAEVGTRAWEHVVPLLAPDAGYVRYDRPGYGASDDDGEPPTPQHVAQVLHAALAAAGLRPPYVLVGHSLGGSRIRMFAGLYPNDVAGLVFVEPAPDFTETSDELRDIYEPLGLGVKEQAEMRAAQRTFTDAPAAVQRELEMGRSMVAGGFADFRTLPPIGDLPVIVLVGESDREWPTSLPGLSFDMRRWTDRWLKVRNESLRAFAASCRRGTFIASARSSHQIQDSEPDLVAFAIQRASQPR
jgi:pimeloyl-ACP methyl ester carboxylesterase